MKFIKKNKKFLLIGSFFLLLVIVALYNFRYEIALKSFSSLGYNEKLTKKFAFSISERPYQIIKNKIYSTYYSVKQKKLSIKESFLGKNLPLISGEELNIHIEIKKNITKNENPNLSFENKNYYLNIDEADKVYKKYKKLEYSNIWENKKPEKMWSIEMSNKDILDKASSKNVIPMIVEAKPKICGSKLIYAKQDGNIGAINFKTGERIWYNRFGNLPSVDWPRMKGFICIYDKNLDTHVIFLPTSVGIFCINSKNGSLLKTRCGGGKLSQYSSRVAPQFFDNTIYVATVDPAGIQALNYVNGKLLWHKDLYGANPWNNFTIDKENELVLVNTGSPNEWAVINNSRKYKYSGSLIALNSKNGKVKWQFQEHSRDSWNHDFVGQPILSPTKIDNKDVVIALSKSGSIYFLNRDNGLPVFPIKEQIIKFGSFNYIYKESIFPKSLLESNYYNYLGRDCKDCNFNTKILGLLPPVIKFERFFNGADGGPQWPGASIDVKNNLLIVPSSNNIIYKQYTDFIPVPPTSMPENSLIKNCTSCHDSKGMAKGYNNDDKIIPSLFLTTKIYDQESLKIYLKKNKFHKNIFYENDNFENAYKMLKKYDENLVKNNNYQYLVSGKTIDINSKNINLDNGPFGKITAISLNTGKRVWEIPAGTYKASDTKVVVGSKTYGAITDGGQLDGVSFYTGSFDKKIYAIDNKNGKYLWNSDLPASGSALPLIYNTPKHRWIFVIATGGRVKSDRSDKIVAFRQRLVE